MSENKKKFDFENLKDLKFPGHEVLKSRLPGAMKMAEAVVDEWKKDGDFNGLPVNNPVAQVALGMGLRKAKDLEKKLEEKGVFMVAGIGVAYAKSQAQKLPLEKIHPGLAQLFADKNQFHSDESASVESEETFSGSMATTSEEDKDVIDVEAQEASSPDDIEVEVKDDSKENDDDKTHQKEKKQKGRKE